jgi:hypothetical protein
VSDSAFCHTWPGHASEQHRNSRAVRLDREGSVSSTLRVRSVLSVHRRVRSADMRRPMTSPPVCAAAAHIVSSTATSTTISSPDAARTSGYARRSGGAAATQSAPRVAGRLVGHSAHPMRTMWRAGTGRMTRRPTPRLKETRRHYSRRRSHVRRGDDHSSQVDSPVSSLYVYTAPAVPRIACLVFGIDPQSAEAPHKISHWASDRWGACRRRQWQTDATRCDATRRDAMRCLTRRVKSA